MKWWMRLLLFGGLFASGLLVVSCESKTGDTVFVITNPPPPAASAVQADLSGAQDVATGSLGASLLFAFPAVQGQSYSITLETNSTAGDDVVLFEVQGEDGSLLGSGQIDGSSGPAPGVYAHTVRNRHVLVTLRPRDPSRTDINVISLKVSGLGTYPAGDVHINVIVVGDFTGLGSFSDLATDADRAAFVDAIMDRARELCRQANVTLSYEVFVRSAAEVRALQPTLIDASDRAVSAGGERVSPLGFGGVATSDLDRWADFGSPQVDPVFARGHGVNVFLIHHFATDGVVGLAPRPGVLVGNGPGSALACAAFLGQGGAYTPRSAVAIGLALAHEVGHFLGLLHTTTFSPSPYQASQAIDDGLADTPACSAPTDANADGRIGLGDGCPDEGNVMFHELGAQSALTTGQGAVMRAMLSSQEH